MQSFTVFRPFKVHHHRLMRFTGINSFISLLSLFLLLSASAESQTSFTYHSSWSWLKGSYAATLSSTWKNPGFDDSAWSRGDAPFHYGDGTGGTELADMINSYSTVYLRSAFQCSNSSLITKLHITADYDDGFIIWINGNEALRSNAPSIPSYNSISPANHESGTGEEFIVDASSLNLVTGTNIIAVQGFNVNLTSSDFYFDMEMTGDLGTPEFPDSLGVSFSMPSGYYTDPFSVTLTSPYPSARIIYTLDGSNPQATSTGITADSPVSFTVDPVSTNGRPATPGVIIRAAVTADGYKPSKPRSATYIFTSQLKKQSYPGGEWPAGNVNGQTIDLAMDSKIVDNPIYSGLIVNSFLDIPSISIVTDIKNLFDPASGIYVNAYGHGENWEKECSVELLPHNGDNGFRINAGLRIRGGWSRHQEYPKHSFRLFFREKYGSDMLHYPLFGEEGASEFEKMDLRCEQNYSWANGSSNNSLVREVFSRDTQRDMGEPYTRSRYYHLFIDGMYWGVYQTQERSEASYASTYFGGSKDDYDVIKVNTENYAYTIEATDGNTDSWQKIWNMCTNGFYSNADYFRLLGRDKDGNPVKGSEVLVDIDNLIDYMLVIFYTGNFDSPTSSFGNNKGCNNFFAIDDRTDKSKGFVFFAHDSEHSLFDEAHSPGIGLSEDRVNIGNRSDALKMEVSGFNWFHPQWLHFKLSENAEYRQRFADRAYKAFEKGGALSAENNLARINKRIAEVSLAVIAESARWGDPYGSWAYDRNNNWQNEINRIRNNFIPFRNSIVISQLLSADLYDYTKAPEFYISSEKITLPQMNLVTPLKVNVRRQSSFGTIYFTLDGSDPRNAGGAVNTGARSSNDDFTLTISKSAVLKARVQYKGQWSPVEEVNFIYPEQDFSRLKITEINYHPKDFIQGRDTIASKDLEFLEFKNIGRDAVNLSGLTIDSAVSFSFPDNILLPPGRFFVAASKPKAFYEYYGLTASGKFKGNFSNSGEEILLRDSQGHNLMDFAYSDSSPWPSKADGDGYSLSAVQINPLREPSDYSYWTASYKEGGTPFADNSVAPTPPGSASGGYLQAYPNPTTGYLEMNVISESVIDMINLQVVDINGKVVFSTRVSNPGIIDLAAQNLPAGIYFLKSDGAAFKSATRIVLLKQ
jgi:hypothetical protein